MTAFRPARTESHRLTSGRLALLAITLIPPLDCATYPYANGNPYHGRARSRPRCSSTTGRRPRGRQSAASRGGTFRWQTIPEVVHLPHQVLPPSHVVNGLRYLLHGEPGLDTAGGAACGYLAASLLPSTVTAWRKRVRTPARRTPEPAL